MKLAGVEGSFPPDPLLGCSPSPRALPFPRGLLRVSAVVSLLARVAQRGLVQPQWLPCPLLAGTHCRRARGIPWVSSPGPRSVS